MKVLLQAYPSMGSPEEQRRLRPIGRSVPAFQRTLASLINLAVTADELGYWGLSHTEHHFHSEGLELSPDPGLYNLYLGARTTRLHHGQLGFVASTHDPIRLAERCAMLDHMLEGRFFVGLARGYQTRWVGTLGQKFGAPALSLTDHQADETNRKLLQEHFRIMREAWTSDLLQYRSAHYEAPFPYIEGIADWGPVERTRQLGVPGEVDADGRVVGVSVVPRPYTQPHPRVFMANSASHKTVHWCAANGITPVIMTAPDDKAIEFIDFYHEQAQAFGHDIGRGDRTAVIRYVVICDAGDEERRVHELLDGIWEDWYRHFGYLENAEPGESAAQWLLRTGLAIAGPAEHIAERLAVLDAAGTEFLVWHLPWGLVDEAALVEQLQRFQEEVVPLVAGLARDWPEEHPERHRRAVAP